MADLNLEVVKSDTTWVEISADRAPSGLELLVKADPRVEEFFKALSGGGTETLDAYGRNWHAPLDVHGKPKYTIPLYSVNEVVRCNGYSFTSLCLPIVDEKMTIKVGAPPVINLSFLRFVGISQGSGVRFVIDGPISRPEINRLLNEPIKNAVTAFVRDYITPTHATLRVISQSF